MVRLHHLQWMEIAGSTACISKEAAPDGCYKCSRMHGLCYCKTLVHQSCSGFKGKHLPLSSVQLAAGNRAMNAAYACTASWELGLQADLGGFALVQQAQPLQLHVWVVTQSIAEGSVGQISYIGSLPHNLLQAFC